LWEGYLFSGDITFLRERVWPVISGAAHFYLGWLMERCGFLVTCPSVSPESHFIDAGQTSGFSYACTMDIAIIREVFEHCLEAMKVLGKDKEDKDFAERLRFSLDKLPPYQIGVNGRLQEWIEDYEEHDKAHRHLSHLYGLYPANHITPEETPELAEACAESLRVKGSAGMSWSSAWRVCLWARLKDAGNAYRDLLSFLTPAQSHEISYTEPGIGENLLCAMPFQVDGSFGITAAIAEMLIQSHTDIIECLPALPKQWGDGYFRGLRARGGKTVDVEWRNGAIVRSHIY
jgi:alpha-L-fucosidase 2